MTRGVGSVAYADEPFSTDAVGVTAAPVEEPGGENVYDLIVNGEATTLDEGETATFPLQSAPPATGPGTVSPDVLYPGNGGTISVTASAGSYHWSVIAPLRHRL